MRLVWVVIPLVLFGIVGISESFGETQRILDININRGNEKIEIISAYSIDSSNLKNEN